MIEILFLVGVLLFLSYLFSRPRVIRLPPLPFDPRLRPFVTLYIDNTPESYSLRLSVLSICQDLGVPVDVKPTDETHPLPSVYVQNFLWFTYRTYSPSLFRRWLKKLVVQHQNLVRDWLSSHRNAFVIFGSRFFAEVAKDYPELWDAYISRRVYPPSDYVLQTYRFLPSGPGVEYSPYLVEALERVGIKVLDYSELEPYSEQVFVISPEQRVEV